jgi:parvulin-like peptidyl-prolyl isomerase
MFRYLLAFATILLCSLGYSQEDITFESELDSITNEVQATTYIEQHKALQGKIIIFNKEKHHSRLANDLFELGKGGKKMYENEIDKTYYKLIERFKVPHYRISYIVLDGNKKSMDEISKLRSDIKTKFQNGTPFEELAKQYSMDINAKRGGDSGWFAMGEMLPEFEGQIINNRHKIGDLFTFEIPSKNWFYVALKTYDKMMIEEIKVLKVVEPISR